MYGKTDRSQLLTIACSQENEKIKMMAEAGAPKLKLSRSGEELLKIKGSCLKFLLYSFPPLVNVDFSEPEARKFKAYTA